MRFFFQRHLAVFLTGVIVQVLIVGAVLLDKFLLSSPAARSVYDVISSWTVSHVFYRFLVNWAELLSAFAVCLVILALYVNFSIHRRRRALTRLHDWAKKAVLKLAGCHREPAGSALWPKIDEETRNVLDELEAKRRDVLSDAQFAGGDVKKGTEKAFAIIGSLDGRVAGGEPVSGEIQTLQHELAGIMIAAFTALKSE